ncbi:MAG: hypothetical protein DRI61_11730, partial [Chloroflexi bacterium]
NASDNNVGDIITPIIWAYSKLDDDDPTGGGYSDSFWRGDLSNQTSYTVFGNLTVTNLNTGDSVYKTTCGSPNTVVLRVNVTDDRGFGVTGLDQVNINTPAGACNVVEEGSGVYNCTFNPDDSLDAGTYNWNATANGSYYHNSSESPSSIINILGCMVLNITEPLNGTFFNRTNNITIKVNITDSVGIPLTTANVTANLTMSNGSSNYPVLVYNTNSQLWEANYTIEISNPEGMWKLNVSANKTNYGMASQTVYVNVKRNLTVNITSPLGNAILYRSSTYSLNSTVNTSDGIPGYNYTVYWRNDSGDIIGSGGNTTWTVPVDYSRGVTNLTANVSGLYYNPDEDNVSVKIYGYSMVSYIDPPSQEKAKGEIVNITCGVFDSNFSSTPIQGYYVTFKKNGSTQAGVSTNSTGYAVWSWDTSAESTAGYNITCEIETNTTSYYEPSVSLNWTYISIAAKLRIENLQSTQTTIYRTDSYSPWASNVSGTVWYAAQDVVEGATIHVWDDTGDAATCLTGADGFCWLWYNTTLSPGPYTLEINATKVGLPTSSTYNVSINVWGKLQPWINTPANNSIVHSGDNVSLTSTTKDDIGVSVTVNATWYSGTDGELANGENITWNISPTYTLGPETLNLTVNKSYHDGNSTNITIEVWGWSNISLQSPAEDNYTYGQSINISCIVRDNQSGENINGYNVSFFANNSMINYSSTNSSGIAYYSWTPSGWNTSDLGVYVLMCNITDNATAYYNASSVNNGTVNVNISDNRPPSINGTVSPAGIESNQVITLTANVTDDIEVDSVWVNLTRPNGNSTNITLIDQGGGIYNNTYSDTGDEGIYNITFYANDSSGNENSSTGYNFTVTSTTTVVANISYAEPLTANDRNITLNVSCVNTGLVTAYSANITAFNIPSGWSTNFTTPQQCGNINSTESCMFQANITFPSGQFTGDHVVNATCEWRNPDTTTDSRTGNLTLSDTVDPSVNEWNLIPVIVDIHHQYVNINANITDNIELDYVQVYIQDGGFETEYMTNIGGVWWEYNYTPSTANTYTVQIHARDTSGNTYTSTGKQFTAVGQTTGSLNLTPQNMTVENITQTYTYNYAMKANFTNTWTGTAYYANMTIELDSPLTVNVTNYDCGNVSNGTSCIRYFGINVTNGTPPGLYN